MRALSSELLIQSQSPSFTIPFCRNYDYENFLCSLLIDGEARRDYLSVRALNVELARIPTLVSEHQIALMRLKFWEDSLKKLYEKKSSNSDAPHPAHPVTNELWNTISRHKLTKRYFDRLLAARKIQNLSFVTAKQMENYAEESVSPVLYLLLEILDCKNVNADHAVSHLGKAQGITNILRSILTQKTRSQYLPLPQEILMKHGVSQERFMRQKPDDKGVEDVVFDVATIAHQHLEKSIALVSKVPKQAQVVFLSAVPSRRFLERLQQKKFNLSDKSLGARDHMLPLALYWNKFRGISS